MREAVAAMICLAVLSVGEYFAISLAIDAYGVPFNWSVFLGLSIDAIAVTLLVGMMCAGVIDGGGRNKQ